MWPYIIHHHLFGLLSASYSSWNTPALCCFNAIVLMYVCHAGGQSFFSRKDSIRTIYTSLHNELKKVVSMGRHTSGGSTPNLEDLLSHLSEQLCHFTQARMEIADFYEKMHSLGNQKTVNSEELVSTLETILQKYSSRWETESSVWCCTSFIMALF